MTDSNYKIFQLYCEHCHWKHIVKDEKDIDLYEIKTSALQTNLPQYDATAGKTIESKPRKQKTKYRCPACGHIIIPKLIADTQQTLNAKEEIEQRALERKQLEESILKDRGLNEKNRSN